MKSILSILALAACTLAAPVAQGSYDGYGDYKDVPAPGTYSGYGDYKDVPAPAPAPAPATYGDYPPPAGGYGTYGAYKKE